MINQNIWQAMLTQINTVIADDIQAGSNFNSFIQRCFAVKCGINNLLDLARKAFSERLQDLKGSLNLLINYLRV